MVLTETFIINVSSFFPNFFPFCLYFTYQLLSFSCKKSNRDCSIWWYIRQIPQLYNWGICFSSCKLHYWLFLDQPLYENYSLPREIYYSSLCLFLGQTSIMTGHFESTNLNLRHLWRVVSASEFAINILKALLQLCHNLTSTSVPKTTFQLMYRGVKHENYFPILKNDTGVQFLKSCSLGREIQDCL